MTAILTGPQIRQILLGQKVDRATATLPQTATGHLFQVTGGRILVTGLVGEVTVATGATATNAKLTSTPTTGTAVDLAANVAVTSKEIGAQLTLPATSGSALIVKNGGAGGQFPTHQPYIVPIGYIDLITDASDTGSVKWSITYIPLDNNGSVAAV